MGVGENYNLNVGVLIDKNSESGVDRMIIQDLGDLCTSFDGSENSFSKGENFLRSIMRRLAQKGFVFRHDYLTEKGDEMREIVSPLQILQYDRDEEARPKKPSSSGLLHNGSLRELEGHFECVLPYSRLANSSDLIKNWTGLGLRDCALEGEFQNVVGRGNTSDQARLDALRQITRLAYQP